MKRRHKGFLINLLLVLGSLLLVGIAGELMFRFLGGASFTAKYDKLPQGPLCRYDPILGWSGIPYKKGSLTGDDDMAVMHVAMNGEGFFDSQHQVTKPPGKKRILFLGDSFTIGFGVSRKNRYTDRIGEYLSPEYEVINMGMWGWSTDQELLVLKEKGLKYSPDVVVLAMFVDDISNCHLFSVNEGLFLKPRFFLAGENALKLGNVPVADNRTKSLLYNIMTTRFYRLRNRLEMGKEFRKLGFFAVFDKNFLKEYKYTLPLRLVSEVHGVSKSKQSKFLLVIIPYMDQLLDKKIYASGKGAFGIPPERLDLGLPQKVLKLYCKKEGIPVLDLLPVFRVRFSREKLFFRRDLHWTEAGHRLAAKSIIQHLRQLDYL
ncbi:MAG: hypothetical protein JRJ51_16305 [Deltaproteobacteria bacterium]|nr:hypothetical protein [Deltaproteobacteria bacterium]